MQESQAEPANADSPQREAMRAAARRIDRVTDWLRVGGALRAEEYERFREAGITHVVDLREEDDPDAVHLQDLGISRRHVPVPDRGAPTIDQLTEVVVWFEAQDSGAAVYVHCGGGFGRAATMAVGMLVQQGVTLDGAVEQVRAARPEIRLNDDQMAWLRTVEDQNRTQGSN